MTRRPRATLLSLAFLAVSSTGCDPKPQSAEASDAKEEPTTPPATREADGRDGEPDPGGTGDAAADPGSIENDAPSAETSTPAAEAVAPAGDGEPAPALANTCESDDDCAWSLSSVRDDGCCIGCANNPGNVLSVSKLSRWCSSHRAERCPAKKCAKPGQLTCRSGKCIEG